MHAGLYVSYEYQTAKNKRTYVEYVKEEVMKGKGKNGTEVQKK